MKKIFFLIFILIAINTTLSYSNSSKKKFKSVGVVFSPDYCYRGIFDQSGNNAKIIQRYNSIDVPRFGYTTGFNFKTSVFRAFSIETGLQYSKKGYQTRMNDINLPNPDIYSATKFQYNFSYVEMPLKFQFNFDTKRCTYFVGAGVAINFLLSSSSNTIVRYRNGEIATIAKKSPTTSDYNRLNTSLITGFGLNYGITDKLSLFAEPHFKYGLSKIINAPVSANHWSVGLAVGINYMLK